MAVSFFRDRFYLPHMTQSDPLSFPLQRCGVPKLATGSWYVRLASAVEQYQLDLTREAAVAKGGAAVGVNELNAFHRSLRRSNNPTVAAKRIARLSPEAHTFITMYLRFRHR